MSETPHHIGALGGNFAMMPPTGCVLYVGPKSSTQHKIPLTPGSHRICSTDKSTGPDLDAKPGETYYVRVDIQVGFWKGHGGVTLVDPQEGKYEVTQAAHQGSDRNQ